MFRNMLEKRLKFINIPNLMFILVSISVFVFVIDNIFLMQNGRFFLKGLFNFDYNLILKGQIWRLFTFIFLNLEGTFIKVAIEAYCLYTIGTSLEVALGSYKFSLYYIFGVLLLIISGLIVKGTTITYLNMSLFFIFAAIHPNRQVLLFNIIPLDSFWIGVLNAAYFFIAFLMALVRKDFVKILALVVAIINFLIFFGRWFFIDMFKKIKNLHEKSKRMYTNGKFWNN